MYDHVSKLFIDADSLVYINAWAAQQTHYMPTYKGEDASPEPFRYKKDYDKFLKEQAEDKQKFFDYRKIEHVLDVKVSTSSIDKAILFMRRKFGVKEIECYLTDDDKTNNRYEIATIWPYKAQRSTRPLYYHQCRQHLIDDWRAKVIVGEEADDAVVQRQWAHYERLKSGSCDSSDVTMIAHIDKDINMCPGWHYNLSKDQAYWVSEIDGLRHFYTQLLTGDVAVDNIPGLYQITGTKCLAKYKKPIESMTDEKEMYEHVFKVYNDNRPLFLPVIDENGEVDKKDYPGTEAVLSEIGQLLWMRRYPMEVWRPPV